MNMPLPFLLDTDTRRIDAAGEQSGVLRAWILSGRAEPQPQEYLWPRLQRGTLTSTSDAVRATRATDQVTTWWFITSRRIGFDLHLVEGRVPVSRDALRVLLEPDLCSRRIKGPTIAPNCAGAFSVAPISSRICAC